MTRTSLLALAVLAAAAIAAGTWLLLGDAPAPPGPPPPPPPAERGTGSADPRDGTLHPPRPPVPPEVRIPVLPEPPAEEPPLPPGLWPGALPEWWEEGDRKFRETEIAVEKDFYSARDLAERLERETGIPVGFGPGLEKWAAETRIALEERSGPARGVVDALAARLNLEPVLERDALRFYPRGKAPPGAVAAGDRLRRAVDEARARRAGDLPPDESTSAMLARTVEFGADREPLRDAAKRLGEILGVPVHLDRPVFDANPAITIDPGTRTLEAILGKIAADAACVHDATNRRVVLFRP